MDVIEVSNLTKKFSPPRGLMKLVAKSALKHEVVAVDHVSFTARGGEILAFVGPKNLREIATPRQAGLAMTE